MTELSLNCGAASDVGLVRDHNEDRYWVDPAHGAFLVVDGVGGQAAGERAAEIAVATVFARQSCRASLWWGRRFRLPIRAAARPRSHRRRQQPHLRRIPTGSQTRGNGLRADPGPGRRLPCDHRARRRFAPLPHRSGSHSQSDQRPFAGRRNRRRGRPQRRGSHGASPPQRSIPRRRKLPALRRRGRLHRNHRVRIPRRRGHAAVQRWAERPPDLAPHPRDRRTLHRRRASKPPATSWTRPTRQAAGTTSPRCSSPARPFAAAAPPPARASASPASARGAACGADAWPS